MSTEVWWETRKYMIHIMSIDTDLTPLVWRLSPLLLKRYSYFVRLGFMMSGQTQQLQLNGDSKRLVLNANTFWRTLGRFYYGLRVSKISLSRGLTEHTFNIMCPVGAVENLKNGVMPTLKIGPVKRLYITYLVFYYEYYKNTTLTGYREIIQWEGFDLRIKIVM